MNVAECGVWQGFSVPRIMRNYPEAQVWLFDSFQGHGEPSEFDNAEAHPKGKYSDTDFRDIIRRFPKAQVIVGWIPETLECVKEMQFRFVRIDLDHYWPTKWACAFFRERMELGGIIEFDDYRHPECPGATKAIDEVFGMEKVRKDPWHWLREN